MRCGVVRLSTSKMLVIHSIWNHRYRHIIYNCSLDLQRGRQDGHSITNNFATTLKVFACFSQVDRSDETLTLLLTVYQASDQMGSSIRHR